MSLALTSKKPCRKVACGFTLIELLVSVSILLILVGVLASVTSLVSQTWKTSSGGVGSFQKARAAFDALTQTLSQATLNTYYDYVGYVPPSAIIGPRPATTDTQSLFVPTGFARASELHFVAGYGSDFVVPATYSQGSAVFFQAPLGRSNSTAYKLLNSALNSVGFYVAFVDDSTSWPNFVNKNQVTNGRFRLMQWLAPIESNFIYGSTYGGAYKLDWLPSPLDSNMASPAYSVSASILADDITLLVILPKLSSTDETSLNGGTAPPSSPPPGSDYVGTLLCPYYQYDSRAWMSTYTTGTGHPVTQYFGYPSQPTLLLSTVMRNQLPPLVDVVMIAISEKDALRLQSQNGVNVPAALKVANGTFTSSSSLPTDLGNYENQLQQAHVTYKVFKQTVQIQGSKWSNLTAQ